MARKLVVEVLADVTSFSHNLKQATVASEQFTAGVTSGTRAAAQAVVAASVKTTESLQAQAVAYREIAAAAAVGSQEQIAAARLAERAELKLAAAMGVAAHEADQLRVHSAGLGRELGPGLRGVASGTGIMHGFGRSLAFASGGFLAFEGASKFLTDSISAAREAGVAQRSLAAQMKASGESFAANREQIDRVALSYGKFGFQNDEVVASLTVLERGTGSISRAIQLQGLTADIARAKNIDLAAAANVVAKVFGGQETALRRAVPGLERNAHGLELIRLAQAKLAGQAAANTTVSERFAATLHNTEEIVGTALLPILNQYLTSLSKWLDHMNQTGQLQRDVAAAVKILTGTINAAKTALDAFNTITGSTKDTVKALFGVFVAFKTLRLVSWFDGLAGSIKGAGAAATVAEGETAALSTGLAGLTAAPWVITVLVAYKDIKDPGSILDRAKTLFDFVKKGSPLERALENLPNAGPLAQAVRQAVGAFDRGGPAKLSTEYFVPRPAAAPFTPHDLPTRQAALPVVGRGGLSPMQRAQLALSAAELTKSTKDNLAALVTQRELLAKAIQTETARLDRATSAKAAKKFADNLQKLQGQEAAALDQIASISKQRAAGRTPSELAAQRNTFFDNAITRMLDRVSDVGSAGGRIAALQKVNALITQRIAVTKDITRKLNLEDQVIANLRTIKGERTQQQQDVIDALGLKLSRADLTKPVSDNIAVLQETNAKLAEQNRLYGATRDRQQQIIANQAQIQQLEQQQRDQRKQARETARQNLLDQLQFSVDRTQLTKGLQDDLRALQDYQAGIEKQIATEGATKDLLDRQLNAELAINAKNQEIADARKARVDAAFQDKLGWAQLAVDRADLTDSLTDNLKAVQNQLALVNREIQAHGKTLALEEQRVGFMKSIKGLKQQQADQVAQAAKATDDALKSADQAETTTRKLFKRLNATAFVNQFGADLSRQQKRRLEIGLAAMGPGGTLPAAHSHQFMAGITIHGGVHMHGVQDVPGLENQLAKRAKARPHVRRGGRG